MSNFSALAASLSDGEDAGAVAGRGQASRASAVSHADAASKVGQTVQICEADRVSAASQIGTASQAGMIGRASEDDQSGQASRTIPPAISGRPRIGLALGGGGMRGAAHVGVIRVLQQAGVPIDCIAGTSIGAVIGGMYCAGVDMDTIEKKFQDRSLMRSYMTVPLTVRIFVAPIMLMPRALGHHAYDGLYKGNKFRKYLDRCLPNGETNIESLKVPFAAVALNLVTGKPQALTAGDLAYAMQASSAIPGLRKPVQIGDQIFADGGVMDNVPVDHARALGADIIIAVDVDERFKPVPLDTFRAIGSVSARLIKLQLATIDAPMLKKADIVIHPNVDGIGLISTKKKDALRGIAAGEQAAREALPAIKAKLAQAGIALVPLPEQRCQ